MYLQRMRGARTLCLLMSLMLPLCLLAGCANPANDDAQYEAAFTRYVEALSEQAYQTLYALITPESRRETGEETFLKRHSNIYGDIAAKSIRAEITGISKLETGGESDRLGGRRIAFRMAMDSLAGEIAFDNTADLYAYRQDGGVVFLLDWSPRIIFPDLTADRPVRIDTYKAARGSVYDKNGVLLAGDGVIKSVGLVPGKMGEDPQADIARIGEILEITAEEIEEKLTAAWVTDDVFVPLMELPETDVARKEALLQIPGIRIDDKKGRIYPYGEALSREEEYKDKLRGTDGCRIAITDARGDVITVLAERTVVNGEDVYLDLDVKGNE